MLLGYGCIGQGLTQPLLDRFDLQPEQITIIAADSDGLDIAEKFGITYIELPLKPENYEDVLKKYLKNGDWLINASVDVSSIALIEWCQSNEVLYLDTCVEPWVGGYKHHTSIDQATNYALRYQALAKQGKSTAVIAHGANPGLVSHFVKAGLLKLAEIKGVVTWDSWASLAQKLGVKVIQIAERDSQITRHAPNDTTFFNTWSVDGFLSEAWQRTELGWGTHESTRPTGAHSHDYGDRSGIYLSSHSANVKVRSWVPSCGEQYAYLITHHESLSIANLLTIFDHAEQTPLYRPTVYFAYHPAEAAIASLEAWVARNYVSPDSKRVMREEIIDGHDELGVLFIFDGGAYWYGSTLHIDEARKLAPYNNATSMQVVAGMLAALEWMHKNPSEGVVEAETMDFNAAMAVALPYLGHVSGVLTDWQPSLNGQLQFADFVLTQNVDCSESSKRGFLFESI